MTSAKLWWIISDAMANNYKKKKLHKNNSDMEVMTQVKSNDSGSIGRVNNFHAKKYTWILKH